MDSLDRLDRENLALGGFVKSYASRPEAVRLDGSHTSIRESAVATLLSVIPGDRGGVHLMDVCCGEAALAEGLMRSMDNTKIGQVHYLGVDQERWYINRNRSRRASFAHFGGFEVELCEVSGLSGLQHRPEGGFDLAVLCNTLHEIPPRFFPMMFDALNSLLKVPSGLLYLIDMETLPDDSPESIAIMWNQEEVVGMLRAGGLTAASTVHHKSVDVCSVVIEYSASGVDQEGMKRKIVEILSSKLHRVIEERRGVELDLETRNGEYRKWVVLTGTIARCAEELDALRLERWPEV